MRNCSTFVIWINSHSKLLHMTNLQCKRSFHDLRCFDVILVLSQFTHFCVEQKWTQHSCLWSKKDKYDVWLLGGGVFVMLARNIVTTIVNKLITIISQNSPPNLVTHGIVSLFGTKYVTEFSDLLYFSQNMAQYFSLNLVIS